MSKKFLTSIDITGSSTASGNVSGQLLVSTNSAANEGGQIELALPSSGSTLSGPVTIDVYNNRLRIFEGSGSARGVYIDLTSAATSAGTNLLVGTTGAMNYAQTKGTKQSAISTNGTTIVSVSLTTNGYPVLVTVTGDVENNSAGGWVTLQLYRDSTAIGNIIHAEGSSASENSPYAISTVDTPAAGTYTYALKLNTSAGGTFNFGESNGPVITAIELSGPKGDTGASGMTNPMTTAGDIIYGGASGAPTRLGIGSTSQALVVSGGVPTWGTVFSATSGNGISFTGNTLSLDGDLQAIAALAGTSGILKKTAADTWSLITDNSTNWDSAYTDRLKWDGGSTGLTASTGRTSLGATTVGSNLFTLTNPGAVTFIKINADNTITTESASTFRTSIGAGTGTVTSVATSTGLTGGTITTTGTLSIDTSVVPQLSSGNAFTGANTFVNATGQTIRSAATQDGIVLSGRAGGTTSLAVTLIPTTLTASRTLTLPDVTGTVVTTGDTGSILTAMLASSSSTSTGVTYAKMQYVSATNTVLGRISTGAGVVEELTGANLFTILNAAATTSVLDANNGGTGVSNTSTITLGGNMSTANSFTTSGNFGLTLTTTAATNATLPSGTTTLMSNPMTGLGDLAYGAASTGVATRLAAPTVNGTYVLTSVPSASAAVAPAWALASGITAGSVTNSITFNTSGGAAAGTTFNGSAARTIDYTTVGAAASGHNHSLDSLSNVTITANSAGEILKWSGTAWINNTLAEAGIMSSPLTNTGDIIYSSSGTTAARLGIGTAGQALVVNSGATAPAWTTLTLENIPGAFVKKAVRVATTAALGGTYSNGTAGVGATLTITSTTTLDGVTLANGDRILVKDQATTFQNGIYTRTSATVLTRATDADAPDELSAAMVAVDEGTTNGGLSFDTDFKATDTIGTSAVVWNRMVDAGSTFYIGTTAITAGRTSASQSLTGITSIDGSAASVTNSITFNSGGAGGASPQSFNGSGAVTISYNTIGAAASSHQHSTTDITNLSTWTGNTSISSVGTITVGQWRRAQNPLSASAWGASGLLFAIDSGSLTNTSSSGTVAFQTAASIQNVIFASTNTVTVTDAATFYIASAPSSGTNTTITNSYPLYIGGGPIRLAPATSTTSSLLIAPSSAGAIKSSPVAGDIEFDGTRLLGTLHATTKQGKIGVVQAYRMPSATATSNATTTDTSMFGAGIALESSTVYRFKIFIKADWSSGTANALRINLATGAGTTPTIFYQSTSTGGNAGTSGPNFLVYSTTTGNTVVTDTINVATRAITIEGFLTTGTSAGTWNPQFAASVAGATISINTPTWIEVEKIGLSTVSKVAGAWA